MKQWMRNIYRSTLPESDLMVCILHEVCSGRNTWQWESWFFSAFSFNSSVTCFCLEMVSFRQLATSSPPILAADISLLTHFTDSETYKYTSVECSAVEVAAWAQYCDMTPTTTWRHSLDNELQYKETQVIILENKTYDRARSPVPSNNEIWHSLDPIIDLTCHQFIK